jgi:transcriptional regulator of acetoin/glycerol metabolism
MGTTRTLTASDQDAACSTKSHAQYLVIALDCARPLSPPVRLLLDGPAVMLGRGPCRTWSRSADRSLRVELPDGWISSRHARLARCRVTEHAWTIEDSGSKNGTSLNGVRVVGPTPLHDGDIVEVGNTSLVFRSITHAGTARDDLASLGLTRTLPSTLHPPWASRLATLLRMGRSGAPILLLGETGTGKEVLARAVHTASGRSGPFVPVNCGAIVKTLVESELFGSRKGAFSGATEDRLGLVRSADGGTLFLDEIAELPECSQAVLLRVLQERMVMPVGSTRAIPVDVRIVAATHEDLAARVAEGRFRADLHSRLAGHVTQLPRLAERIEDVGLLIAELLSKLAGERATRVTFTRAAGRALLMYGWPYNVRELEQALTAALAIAPDDQIDVAHLPEGVCTSRASAEPCDAATTTEDGSDSSERQRIVGALAACAGNQTRAAKELGISRATLVNKLAIHRLKRPRKAASR